MDELRATVVSGLSIIPFIRSRSSRIYLPEDLVKAVERRRRLANFQPDPVRTHPSLVAWEYVYDYFDMDEAVDWDLDRLSDEDREAWADAVFEKLDSLGVPEATLAAIDDEAFDEAVRFLEQPSAEVAKTNPLLMHIPDIEQIARATASAGRAVLHDRLREQLDRTRYLATRPIKLPELPDIPGARFECWIRLEHDDQGIPNEDLQDMALWDYQACVYLLVPERVEATLLAVIEGHLIVLQKNGHWVHPDTLFEAMDAHSALLNDVWKVLTSSFLSQVKSNTFEEYIERFAEESGEMPCFATCHIELAEQYRGHRLAGQLLATVGDMFSDALSFDIEAQEEPDDDAWVEWHAQRSFGQLAAFVFPVEGTCPDDVPVAQPALRSSRNKRMGARRRDAAVERRKERLSAYFLSIEPQLRGVRSVVYDPWDYPVT